MWIYNSVGTQVYIYDVPASELDSESAAFTNLTSFMQYEYNYHYSAVILLIVNAGHAGGRFNNVARLITLESMVSGSGYVSWALNNSHNILGMKRHYTTSVPSTPMSKKTNGNEKNAV